MTTESAPNDELLLKHFSDPDAVARYAEGPLRFVPGLDALHRMTGLMLAERVPANARLLVLGAGGGSELRAMAESYPEWTFVGVDPAAEMLSLAERTVGSQMDRVELVQGYIDDAPSGPFDAATCLLTLHFLSAPERERTVRQIHARLRPGAPFVAAHMSFPQGAGRDAWLDRYAAYAIASGVDSEGVSGARAAVAANLNSFDPYRDEEIMRSSGFSDVSLFYAALTWRGWVAYA